MRVAVRVPNWIGDAVMALPAVDAIAAAEQDFVVIAPRSTAAIFSNREVIETSRGLDPGAMRRSRADRVILFTNSFATALSAALGSIRERIGYRDHFRSALLTQSVKRDRTLHQIDEYRNLARAVGYEVGDAGPRLAPPSASVRGKVVLVPGAAYGSAKCWRGFSDLAGMLVEKGKTVSVIGAASEHSSFKNRGAGIENLIGRTSLEEAIEVVSSAEVVVSNDSGMAHVAAALGRRTIVLFGPTDPVKTAPFGAEVIGGSAPCAPCGLRLCPIDHRCMKSIHVADVASRI